ncbi:hypothetical protein [Rhizobium sp. BK251]|uniref:hypothetical protein n=1 Tax=Rhizobium sp. BK251 TaxID=2512125 RepID=UPI0010522C54|nr:hypothetical protein [Rhizobium sp. BK251]TCL72067.1 hypothetical protein EV286_105328 [Rhizobium sp. BK251]
MTDMAEIAGRPARLVRSEKFAFWQRLLPSVAVYSFVVIGVILALSLPNATDYVGSDNDDGMRLMEVRDLLAGQGWFDLTQYRLGLEGGTLMHWSRLVDLPIANLISFFGLFLAPEKAEAVALAVWPLSLVIPLLAGMALAGRRAGGLAGMHISLGLTALMIATSSRFAPGGIDHHNVQLGLVAVMTAMVLDERRRATSFAIAGLAAALAIAVGAETTPFVAALCLIVAVLWAWEGATMKAATRAFGLSITIAISAFFFLTVPPRLYSAVTCDNLSLGYYSLTALGGGLLAAAAAASRLPRIYRFGMLGGIGAATFAAAVVLAPQCLRGPLANLDPMLVELWLNGIVEAQSFLALSRHDATSLGTFYMPGLFAIAVCLFRIRRGEKVRVHGIMLALLLVSYGIAVVQVRGSAISNLLAVIPLALLLADLRRISNSDPEDMGAAFLYVLATLISVPAVWAVGGALANSNLENLLAATNPPTSKKQESCTSREALAQLASLPTGVVAASSELGVPILRFTGHRTLSAPYHRNQGGMLTELHIGLAEPREAEAFLRGAGVTIIAFCPSDAQTVRLSRLEPHGLYADLLRGRIPGYLQQVRGTPASGDLQLFLFNPPVR